MPPRRRRTASEGVNAGDGVSSAKAIASSRSRLLVVACAILLAALFFYLKFQAAPEGPRKQVFPVCGAGHLSVDTSYDEILQWSSPDRTSSSPSSRCLNTLVLAYVTPWNSKGYDMAKKYRAKFTHVSPVWYQLKKSHSLSLMGKHDADQAWIKSVRQEGLPLIVPRVVLEGWPLENMLLDSAERLQAIELILNECREVNYDGIVLEAWSAWASFGILANEKLRQKALEFVKKLGSKLQKSGLQLVLVIPPLRGNGPEEFSRHDLEFLQDSVNAFSLMTYDYSNAYSPGPSAPINWVRACLTSLLDSKSSDRILASKVLVGLNFYGNDFVIPRGGGPIVGDQFTALLKDQKPRLSWEANSGEHFFEYYDAEKQQRHRVYYPTLQSLALRIEQAKLLGAGISIWEIGQGLEPMFDLL